MGRLSTGPKKTPGQLLDDAIEKAGGSFESDEVRESWLDYSYFRDRIWRKSNDLVKGLILFTPLVLSWILAAGLVKLFGHIFKL